MADLTGGFEALEWFDEFPLFEDRPRRAVQLIEVDVIRAQPLQAPLGGLNDVAGRKVLGRRPSYGQWHALATDARAHQQRAQQRLCARCEGALHRDPIAELRGDDGAAPAASQRLPEESLALAVRIQVRGVKERDPEVESVPEQS